MVHESGKEVLGDRDSMFARLSELCPSPISFFHLGGPSAIIPPPSSVNSTHGKRLCDGVYAFHEPQEQVDVEIVFIHGLEFDGRKEAYWNTWLARDGTQDNCWPKTWLVEKFPHARILSLSYDANVVQTPTSGRMDPYCLGESLVQEMALVGIGQHECPVVFVCHSFGGLVAKQIVVFACQNLQRDKEVKNLLWNLRAFYFYATPHGGVQVDFSPLNPFSSKGSCMSYLEVFGPKVGRLHFEFEQIRREVFNNEWICYSVGEMHATVHGRVVVPESSARQVGGKFLPLNVGHFDICKPPSKEDSGYLLLVDCISKAIKYNKEKQHHPLVLPNGLVGMDDMQNTICEKLGTTSIIGLVGMGGIGKTTISKSVYNLQAKFFDKTCFLQDVRSKDLASVQKELLLELCGVSVGITNCVSNNHLESIEQCIMERRVLIVIDDVGDSETLQGLQVPTFQRSNSESRVIVTCRNRQVLENHKIREGLNNVEVMEVEFLNDAQALELLRYHVFGGIEDEDEMEDFQGLAMDVSKACCGLPLSLEVIGQHLRKHVHSSGLRKEIWQEALRKLCEAQAFDGGDENEVLWKRLKISYDDLSNDTKSMFLDFACFFCERPYFNLSERSIGWIWNSPIGLQNLVARSLIKIGRHGEFRMHDQLRDMGRRIVKDLCMEGFHMSLKNVTQLWVKEEIESFLVANQSSTIIEGILLRDCSRLAALESQSNPRLVTRLTMQYFDRMKISLLNCLGLSALQSQVNPRLLQEMTIQHFDKLRLLDLTGCHIRIVEFFLRKCGKELSWLCLDYVYGKVMPCAIEAIGFCTRLRVLKMHDIHNLEELPTSIGNLVHLLELDLSSCVGLQSLPDEIGQLKQLKRLELRNCWALKEVPQSINQLIDLEYLGLHMCSNVVAMVEFESSMKHLYELDLYTCWELQIPFKSLGKLYQLRTLNMDGCIRLAIENPSESFGHLVRLEKLRLEGCSSLIPGFILNNFTSEVTRAEVERLWNLVIESFSSRLQELCIPIITQVGFPTYRKLKILKVWNNLYLEELPVSFGYLTQLVELKIYDTNNGYLKKLPTSLCSLVKLEVLELHCFGALEKLPEELGHLSSLKNLKIFFMKKLEELPLSLGQLFQLEDLLLCNCINLKRLPESLGSLTRLSRLNLEGSNALEMTDASQNVLLQDLRQHGCCIIRE